MSYIPCPCRGKEDRLHIFWRFSLSLGHYSHLNRLPKFSNSSTWADGVRAAQAHCKTQSAVLCLTDERTNFQHFLYVKIISIIYFVIFFRQQLTLKYHNNEFSEITCIKVDTIPLLGSNLWYSSSLFSFSKGNFCKWRVKNF